MRDIDRLLAIEEIKQLKGRYFRCVDTKNWEELAKIFAPDVRFDRAWAGAIEDPATGEWRPQKPAGPEIVEGREQVVAMVRRAVGSLRTVHRGFIPEIEIIDANFASAIWPMQDILLTRDNELLLEASGHYHETYDRLETGWAIKSSKLTRLMIYLGPAAKGRVGYV